MLDGKQSGMDDGGNSGGCWLMGGEGRVGFGCYWIDRERAKRVCVSVCPLGKIWLVGFGLLGWGHTL
jgi:hypothetical protein